MFSRRIAADIARLPLANPPQVPRLLPPPVPMSDGADAVAAITLDARQTMYAHVGLSRDGDGLNQARQHLVTLTERLDGLPAARGGGFADVTRWGEASNLLLAARLVTEAAWRRRESRGAHYRADFPDSPRPAQPRQFLTLADLAPVPEPHS